MVDVERRKLLELLLVTGSTSVLLGALPSVVKAHSNVNNVIVDPRPITNTQASPLTCDVIVQPGQSPTGQAQPMVVASDGTIIVDSDGTIVSNLGCWDVYTKYAQGSYYSYSCPGGKTITSGIQEAINYIINTKGSQGGVVCLAPGTYATSWVYSTAIGNNTALVLEGLSNIAFVGAGMDKTTIMLKDASKYLSYFFDLYNASNITIKDLTLLPYDQNNNPGGGIFLSNTNGLVVENVHYKGNGILTTCTAADGTPFPCVACPSNGCSGGLTNSFTPPSSDLVFRNNIIELSHSQLNLRYTKNVFVENNTFRYSLGDHIIVAPGYTTECPPSYNVYIRNNEFLFAGDTAIDLSPQKCGTGYAPGSIINGEIVNNYIETAGNAILAFGTSNMLIAFNTIKQYAGAENGITAGYEAQDYTYPLIIGNRLYNSPGIAGRIIVGNYMENVAGISTYPGGPSDYWYVVGNIINGSRFGIRCGGLYNVHGCTGVVSNNYVYMYGPAGPMGGGVFDFRGPIYDTVISNNVIVGPPLSGNLGCDGTYMPYGIRLTNNSSSQGNNIFGNTIINAKCAYPLANQVDPCMCSGFTSAAGSTWLPIQVANPDNYIHDNIAYATGGQYNYGNLYPTPPSMLKLSLTPGTPTQNPYPYDLDLEIQINVTGTPANVQVFIGPSQSQMTLVVQRSYSATGTDTITVKLPWQWWINIKPVNAVIGSVMVRNS